MIKPLKQVDGKPFFSLRNQFIVFVFFCNNNIVYLFIYLFIFKNIVYFNGAL